MHKLKIHGARIEVYANFDTHLRAVPPTKILHYGRHYHTIKMPLPPHTVVSRVKQRMCYSTLPFKDDEENRLDEKILV
jgi:hypothetical protein